MDYKLVTWGYWFWGGSSRQKVKFWKLTWKKISKNRQISPIFTKFYQIFPILTKNEKIFLCEKTLFYVSSIKISHEKCIFYVKKNFSKFSKIFDFLKKNGQFFDFDPGYFFNDFEKHKIACDDHILLFEGLQFCHMTLCNSLTFITWKYKIFEKVHMKFFIFLIKFHIKI